MGLFLTFLFYVGAFLVTELLRPKPDIENARPAGLGDFNFPTAEEGRVVPLVWGTVRIAGPNVIWFGDLESQAQTEKVKTGLFSSETVTTGFTYFVGMQFGIARGPFDETNGADGIRRIWVDDKQIRTDSGSPGLEPVSSGDIVINKVDFNGEGSNLAGDLEIAPGSTSQAVNSYLLGAVTDGADALPAYRGTIYAVWKQGEVGLSPSLSPWKFELTRCPNGLGGPSPQDNSIIFDSNGIPHANPMEVLFEILTNREWGAGVSASTIDTAELQSVAATLHAENHGFSMTLDNPKQIGDIIQEIERQVDGVLLLDEVTEQYTFILAREQTASPDPTPLADESNTKSVELSRISWDDTINEVRVPYSDPTKDYADSFAYAGDMANERIQNASLTTTMRFPGVKQGNIANIIAWRELRTLAYPLSKLTLRTDRTFYAIRPTDFIDVTWGPLGLSNVRYRVNKVNLGELENGVVVIDAVEDIFQTEISTFGDPIRSRWTPFSADPVQPLYGRLIELPVPLQTTSGTQVAILAARGNSFQTGYDVYTAFPAGGSPANNTSDDSFDFETSVISYTPVALLQGALDEFHPYVYDGLGSPPITPSPDLQITVDNGIEMDRVVAAGLADLSEITSVATFKNYLLIDDEWIFYERVTDNLDGSYTLSGIKRGMMDSVPVPHADNAVVYFPALGIGRLPVDNGTYPSSTDSLIVRVASTTPAKTMSLTNSAEMSLEFIHKSLGDAPPADPFVNNTRIYDIGVGSPTPPFCADLRIEAKGRDLSEQQANGANTTQDDPDEDPQGGTGYVLDIYRTDISPHSLIYRRAGIPHVGDQASPEGIQWNVAASEYMIDSGSPGPVKDYRVEFYSRKLGVDSQAWQSLPFVVTGYGLDYGENYGGCDIAGVNLAQGDPPLTVEPTPGSGTLRRWLITIGGTPGTQDDHRLQGFYFDQLGGVSEFFNVDVDGSLYSTADEVAEYVSSQLSATLPATFAVDRVGGEVTVSTQFGNFNIAPALSNDAFATSFPYGVSLQEEESAATVGDILGAAYGLDFYETVNINNAPTDVLGPNSSVDYAANGSYRKNFRVTGITYDKRKELDFQVKETFVSVPVAGDDTIARGYSASSQDWISGWQASLISSYLATVGTIGPASTPLDRVPQRNSIVGLTLGKNLIGYSGGQTYQSSETQPSDPPYRLVWKEHRIPRVDAPNGLPRTYWLNPAVPIGANGVTVEVEYNGSIIATETFGSPLDAAELSRVLDSLAAQIDATAGITSERLTALPRTEVRGANNVNYDLQLYSGYGLRIKFEEL
jgi:hypothetical protein